MVTVSPTTVIVDNKLHERETALKQEEKRVKILKKLLRSARGKRDQLRAELSSYQCSVAPSPIKKLSEDILLIIFKYYISENRKLIGRLLLVNKRWYSLVVHHPLMWNVIHLDFPEGEWDVRSWARSAEKFITKCLERSKSAPLHVRLNLDSLQTGPQQIMNKITSSFPNGFPDDVLMDWLSRLDYDALVTNDSMIEKCLPIHVLKLLKRSVAYVEVMERWETAEVSLPNGDDHLAGRVWEILDNALPNVSHLRLYNLDHLYDLKPEEIFPNIPDFSKVRYLTLDQIHDWDLLSYFPSSLEEMIITIYSNQPLPSDFSRFTRLRTLSVQTAFHRSMEILHPKVQITLPCLQELSLLGRVEHLCTTEFKLPILKTLILDLRRKNFAQRELPVIHSSQVKWSPLEGFNDTRDLTKVALRRILQHFTGSETLSVPSAEREILSEVLGELSSEEALPPIWKFIALHEDDEIVESIGIRDLLRIP